MRRCLAVAVLLVAIPATAAAQSTDHQLGERGQYLLTTDTRFDYRRSSFTTINDDGEEVDVVQTRFDGGLAVDRVLLRPHLTIGLHMGFEADSRSSGYGIKSFFTGVRLGKLFDLGGEAELTLWPRVGLNYGQITYQASVSAGGGQATEQVLRLSLSMPLVVRPVARFFLGGGPKLEYDLYAAVGRDAPIPKTLTIGFEAVLGVWFHGF